MMLVLTMTLSRLETVVSRGVMVHSYDICFFRLSSESFYDTSTVRRENKNSSI